MRAGEIVEINNIIPHSVVNNGEDRVHLVVDIVGIREEYRDEVLDTPIPDQFYIKEK